MKLKIVAGALVALIAVVVLAIGSRGAHYIFAFVGDNETGTSADGTAGTKKSAQSVRVTQGETAQWPR